MKKKLYTARGAVLTEAAIVLPIFILLILGGISLFEILYTRSAILFALQEGMRLAQSDSRLQVDLFSLNPAVAADLAKINDYKTARDQLISRTTVLLNNRTLIPITLEKTSIDGTSGGSAMDLAFLPPSFSGRVGGWSRDVRNGHNCTLVTVSVPDPNNPGQSINRQVCDQSGSYLTAIATYPTEFHAFANVKTPIFGTVKTEVAADAYLASAAASAPPSSGNVVGGYTLNFSAERRAQNGVMIRYAGHNKWGRVVTANSPDGGTAPTCEAGLNTLHLFSQRLFTTSYIANVSWASGWRNPIAPYPYDEAYLGSGNSAGVVAQFFCLTK